MKKNYLRSKYTEKQWKALIDQAVELGCQIEYDKYGTTASIDSTELENRLIEDHPSCIGTVRNEWGETIHSMIKVSTDLRVWKVKPKKYRRGYCSTTFKNQYAAENERERLERITGFEWTIIVEEE